ncbi:hypothetical protein HRQ65_01665 [Tatlockia micdadei]|uniref:hypothetical protein n=1 Tax=Legionella micdadei TaxID=451 RepID=UPI00157077EE|nr:hypothetical protein [Legionella micdadei]NSL17088.1 hypothetical protein [Legionella micdadei]
MKKDTNQELLAAQFNEKIQQVENDFAQLMGRIGSIDSSSGLKVTQDFTVDFSQKIINALEDIAAQFPALVENWHGLPPFMKQEDIMTLIERIPPLGLRLTRLEPWMKRLAYGDGESFTQPYADFKTKISQTKIYTTESDQEQILTSFARFENKTLAARSNYEKLLRNVEKAYQGLAHYKKANVDKSGLTGERASALTAILNDYSRIPLQLEEAELKRFKQSEAYLKAQENSEHLLLSQRHMKHYQECLPLEKQINFLNEILTSQQSLDEDIRRKYSILFKHHTNPIGLLKQIKQIDSSPIIKLTELRDALVAAENARRAFIKADSELPEPLLSDRIVKAQDKMTTPAHETTQAQHADSEKKPAPSTTQDQLSSQQAIPGRVRKMTAEYEQMLAKRGIFKAEKKHDAEAEQPEKPKPSHR